jgi:hypothetical protein
MKVFQAIVLLVAKIDAEIPDNIGLHKQVLSVYLECLSIFTDQIVDTLLL